MILIFLRRINCYMKKRFFAKLFLLSILFSLVSCFDIIEEISLKDDGSGEMILTANLSKSKTKIASLMLLDSVNGHKVPDRAEIEKSLNEAVKYLEEQNGISNVTKKADFTNYIFAIQCDFASVENINTILSELASKNNMGVLNTSYKFSKSERKLVKNYTQNAKLKTEFVKLSDDDKKVFDDAYYTYIYRFNNEIESFSNKNAKVSKSKKAIMQKTLLLDLINGTSNVNNQIKTK